MGKRHFGKIRDLFLFVIEGPPLIPLASPNGPPPEIAGLMIRAYVKTVDWFPWPIRPFFESLFLDKGVGAGCRWTSQDVSPDETFKQVDPTFGFFFLTCRKMPRQIVATRWCDPNFCGDFLPQKNWFGTCDDNFFKGAKLELTN